MGEGDLSRLRAGLQTALAQQDGRAQLPLRAVVVGGNLRVVQNREVGGNLPLPPLLPPSQLVVRRIPGTAPQPPQPLTARPSRLHACRAGAAPPAAAGCRRSTDACDCGPDRGGQL